MNAATSDVTLEIDAHQRLTSNLELIGRFLRKSGYSFVAVTPETHRRVMANNPTCSDVLRDIFGWNRSFARQDIDDSVFCLLDEADGVQPVERSTALHRSRVRFATLGKDVFAHSSFPTEAADSVFFGPDTYRFAALIERVVSERQAPTRQIIDIGCGSGAGAIVAWRASRSSAELVLADINAIALTFAEANAAIAGVESFKSVRSDVFAAVDDTADLIVSNPPYLCDPKERLYRHGGNLHGAELSLRILRESLSRLRLHGQLILYTGTAIVDGIDTFKCGALPYLSSDKFSVQYEEIDPDVFGEELDRKQYEDVERIAAIGLVVTRIH